MLLKLRPTALSQSARYAAFIWTISRPDGPGRLPGRCLAALWLPRPFAPCCWCGVSRASLRTTTILPPPTSPRCLRGKLPPAHPRPDSDLRRSAHSIHALDLTGDRLLVFRLRNGRRYRKTRMTAVTAPGGALAAMGPTGWTHATVRVSAVPYTGFRNRCRAPNCHTSGAGPYNRGVAGLPWIR